ncbi:hypothetical protein RintRC_3204 [Richelia intracellularis]|nr:hypothetical protein RintRC_3204 [Richelia intracellularis]
MLYQRWLVLRAPVGMARGTETVHYEDSAFNLGATLLVVRSMITQYDIRIINDKSTRVVLTAKNVLDGIGL